MSTARILLAFAGAMLFMSRVSGAGEPERSDGASRIGCANKPVAPSWIDRMQVNLYRATCLAAARFDGMFGSDRFDSDYQATRGRVAAGLLVSERDQLKVDSRFRVHLPLPQLSERVGLFIGDDEADETVGDAREEPGALRQAFGLDRDDDVLIGLGYRRPVFGGGSLDTSIGAHFHSGFDPYVRGRYRLALPFLERNVVRLSESLFWQDALGVGVTSRIDVDRLVNEEWLMRWTGSVTVAERTEGMRWWSAATLYQSLGLGRALAYQVGASGESEADVPLSDYGVQLIFRRRFLRDWLFLEARSGVSWPRDAPWEARERNLSAGVGLEMWFGELATKP